MRRPWMSWLRVAVAVAVVGTLPLNCGTDRRVCEALDLSGTWTEQGRPDGENSTLVVQNTNGKNDVTVTWNRTTPYPKENVVLDSFIWPPERNDAMGNLRFGENDKRDPAGDNLAPQTGTTRLHVMSRKFGCRPSFPQTLCEVRYELVLTGRSAQNALSGTVEIWRDLRVGPDRTLDRIRSFPVTFVRTEPLESVPDCDGVEDNNSDNGGGCTPVLDGPADGSTEGTGSSSSSGTASGSTSSSGGSSSGGSGAPGLGPMQVDRLSIGQNLASPDGDSDHPVISADGRYVAFSSAATNLVPSDINGAVDVFLHDRVLGTTSRVSAGEGGVEANGSSNQPAISADGRYVAFSSAATNLVPDDDNGVADIFIKDWHTGAVQRVTASANADCTEPAMSADGRVVAFVSASDSLVTGDDNALPDVFVHDTVTVTTTRVSVSSDGTGALGGASGTPVLSGSGRLVAFASDATNLIADDTNGVTDVFLHDRLTGTTTRISTGPARSHSPALSANGRTLALVTTVSGTAVETLQVFDLWTGAPPTGVHTVDGAPPNGPLLAPSLSAGGRYVALASTASNLLSDDTVARLVYVQDLGNGQTEQASASRLNQSPDDDSDTPALSGDGLHVAFTSRAGNLVLGDGPGTLDVFAASAVPLVDGDRDARAALQALVELVAPQRDRLRDAVEAFEAAGGSTQNSLLVEARFGLALLDPSLTSARALLGQPVSPSVIALRDAHSELRARALVADAPMWSYALEAATGQIPPADAGVTVDASADAAIPDAAPPTDAATDAGEGGDAGVDGGASDAGARD
ncbi:MAG: hypothetical protein AB2A00_26365 [Myxococcota bacterium]